MNRIARAFVLFALTLATLTPLSFAQVAGDWQATLVTPGPKLRLLMHVAQAKDGSLTATMESVDQGATFPLTTIKLKDSALTFTIDPVHASYEGTVNTAATEIDGTFTQGMPLPLKFTRAVAVAAAKPAPPSAIDGTWQGMMNLIGNKSLVVFHIVNTGDGLKVTEQIPNMGAKKIQATSATLSGSLLTVKFAGMNATYQGDILPDRDFIDGTFGFAENGSPLRLMRVEDKSQIERPRPQNPIKPYPYREEEVTYDNNNAGDMLAGTLTIPAGKGPFPAVLLIAGAGGRDRDESFMGHKPFLVLSDYLTRHGIVVLRVDKRGVGKSSGDYAASTTANFATDADAGVAFLKTRAEVDPHKIGLVGHSEGGEIAAMEAATNRNVAYIVMTAGPGLPGDQIVAEQLRLTELANGASQEKAARDAALERELLTLVETEKDEEVLDKKLHDKLIAAGVSEDQSRAQIKEFGLPWFRYFIAYDPATALGKVKCPVLALDGSLDQQVPAAQNLPAIGKALEAAGNKRFEAEELPGLNHFLQTARTGSPAEYAQIDETISPLALEKISTWILKQ